MNKFVAYQTAYCHATRMLNVKLSLIIAIEKTNCITQSAAKNYQNHERKI